MDNTPISLKIDGNATKMSPVPSVTKYLKGTSWTKDIYPKMENTPIAVKNSNPQFAIVTTIPFLTRLVPFGR